MELFRPFHFSPRVMEPLLIHEVFVTDGTIIGAYQYDGDEQ